ncbi:hypothetical protein L593_04545 [Salinarchaeum sp. Harcht-Bsk1]|uniref:hypothetical protein n=1 Tax=Salinarchaeum sp. Harcht-Bsk1 TaxID=1333523 RepID=UPI00034241E3|nr:hypothetical protein [Salinarchaeum sp. Harcht-Bsk1]AGN00860.1 hypothetical protein L593_04545 [Salinarchaeum sp. Harcht-Bsk1]
MTRLDRRALLRTGAFAAAAATAGCIFARGGAGERSFTRWLPRSQSGLVAAHLDLEIDAETQESEPLLPLILPDAEEASGPGYTPQIRGLDGVDDPMLTVPLALGARMTGLASIGLYAAGLGYLVDPEESATPVTKLINANDVLVAPGDVDTARAAEELRSGSPDSPFSIPHERVDEYGGFERYEPTTQQQGVVAVDDAAVVVADDRAGIEAVIDTFRGERTAATEAHDRLGWLFDTAREGHIGVGWLGDPDLEPYFFGEPGDALPQDAIDPWTDLYASIEFDPNTTELRASLSAYGVDGASPAQNRVASRFGSAGIDRESTIESDRVSVSAAYGNDVLDVRMQPRDEQGGSGDEHPDPDDEVPPAVDAGVPEDAFRFEYTPAEDRVDVYVEAELDVDSITVRTVESEWENSTSDTDVIEYLTVYVDPEGDEVHVIATVDDESGVVARYEVE